MFQPETEDMLPRAAPKPSANLESNQDGIRTSVPEVSILFGQQGGATGTEPAAATQMPTVAPQTTYAAWKKKMLPRVTYPPELMTNNSTSPTNSNQSPEYAAGSPRSNIYPLRNATAAVSPLVTTSSSAECLQYQRESTAPIYNSHDYGFANTNAAFQQQQQQQRRSLDTVLPRNFNPGHDVLTICAGTQTVTGLCSPDTVAQSHRNLASKQDVEQLQEMLHDMRAEQQRLTQICEALLVRQRDEEVIPRKTYLRDIGTQYETTVSNFATAAARRPIMHEYIDEEEVAFQQRQQQGTPSNAYHNQLKQAQFQSPRPAPVAQSTAYHANTPRSQRPVFVAHLQHQQQQEIMTKPMTEQSMVMNELALKYLPNEKLGELLQELHISPSSGTGQAAETVAQQPVTPIEKCPNDISNASYKYLKKYRLLAEEHGDEYRQTSPRMQSPYQRLAGSPSNMGGGDGRAQELDLEHLRNQPKFV